MRIAVWFKKLWRLIVMDNSPKRVVLHCAASPDSPEGKVRFSFNECVKYHKEDRGWSDIGYHYYITRDGITHKGRPDNLQGAHCKAKGMNKDSLGICYEGSHFPTISQVNAILDLFRQLRSTYHIDETNWFGHYEFANKECPGFDMDEFRKLLRKLA